MLPGEQSLPREILAYHSDVVNQVFDFVCTEANNYRADRFKRIVQALQLWWFRQSRHQLFCPSCGRNQHIRKGWRSRVLRSSQGRFVLLVLQAKCKYCGRTFRPFTEALGLPFSRRFTNEMVEKAIALAIHNSFDRSSKLLAGLTADTVSSEGIRQKIAAKAETITGSTKIAEKTVLVDSTKVKAGNKERGSSVQIAITAEQGPKVSGRPTIKKQLVHLHVGDVETLRDRLSILQPKRLVHDGDVDFSLCADQVQRCRWHLVHQLKHYLWQDGVPFEERGAYQSRLKSIIFGEWSTAPTMLSAFIKELEIEGCLTSAAHLRNARHETFTYRADNNFAYTTTTPLEREMRELNRRADIGVRWSEQGIENILKVLFHYRLNESQLKEPERELLN